MIKNKLVNGILNLVIIFTTILGMVAGTMFLFNDVFVGHADASFGIITVYPDYVINASGYVTPQVYQGNMHTWAQFHDAASGYQYANSNIWIQPEICTDDETDHFVSLHRGVICWDLASANITSLDDISSVTIKLRLYDQQNTFTSGESPVCSLYRMAKPPFNGYGENISEQDYNNLNTGDRVTSQVLGYNEYQDGDWVSFPIYPDDFGDVLWVDNGFAYVSVQLSYDALNYAPVPQNWLNEYIMNFWFNASGAPENYPILEVVTMGELPDRVIVTPSNDDIDTTVTGDEVADNITWISPRCAYDDEAVSFDIAGESGAVLNLALVDKNGTIIASHADSIRVNEHYYYTVDLPDTCQGPLRLIETVFNLKSIWGWSAVAPDSAEADPYTYALYTDYPQYDVPFKDYIVKAGDYLIFHWKTRITTDEYDNASLRIWYLNDSSKELYNLTLAWLSDYYFMSSANNTGLSSWRYAVFALNSGGSGWSSYDGIVTNLNQDYGYNTEGFYTASIYQDGVGEFAIPQSAYWYLNSVNDGITTALNNSEYSAGQDITASLGVGDASKVKTDLNAFMVYLIDKDGVVCGNKMTEVNRGQTDIVIPAPLAAGDYKARFIIMKSGKSYEYIHDVSFTVTGGAGEGGAGGYSDIVGMIENTLNNMHLNSKAGHWIALIIGMAALFLVFMKSSILRVVMPSLLFCAACVFGWIDIWYIALIALADGFLIFGAINRRLHGGGGNED